MPCFDQLKKRFKSLQTQLPAPYRVDAQPPRLKLEGIAQLTEICAGGARLLLAHKLAPRDQLQIELLGQIIIEGEVTHFDDHHHHIKFILGKMKRERLVSVLTQWRALESGFNASVISSLNQREAVRYIADGQILKLRKHDETVHTCRLVDQSLTGISIEAGVSLQLEEKVLINRIKMRVSRRTATGYGLEAINNADLELIKPGRSSQPIMSGNLARLRDMISQNRKVKSL